MKPYSIPKIEIIPAANQNNIGRVIKETIGIGIINMRAIKRQIIYKCY
jgi:hypothetical protein